MEQQNMFTTVNNEISRESLSRTILQQIGNGTEATKILVKMLDAGTKIPTGLMDGNTFDLGNFDECYNIKENGIYGKYCLATLYNISSSQQLSKLYANVTLLSESPLLGELGTNYTGFHFAECVPSSVILEDIPGRVTYNFCYSKDTEPELSIGAIITITVLAVLSFAALISTVCETLFYYTNKTNCHTLLIAASLRSNGRKLFLPTNGQILCLNGLKAITMMWIIFAHEYFIAFYSPIVNFPKFFKKENSLGFMYISGATIAVDTFLTITGVLTVYTFFKTRDSGVQFNIWKYYVHRILRVTPVFGIMILVYTNLVQYLGNGPLWKIVDILLVQDCKTAWWSSILYIANYMNQGDCIAPSWYLSIDMQLFVLSPLVLLPLYKWSTYGLMVLGVLAVSGCVIPFVVGYVGNLGSLFHDGNFKHMYYIQTYTRFGPYVIGMILGYIIFNTKKYKKKIHLHVFVEILLWIVLLMGLVACVYAGHDSTLATRPDRISNSLFLAFNRPAWSLLLCGVIFLCETNKKNPINVFLSLPVFQFLSKLSYSMFLTHYVVIVVRYASMKDTFTFNNIEIMRSFWGDFIVTLFLSIILCLLCESPVITLEKYIFRASSVKRQCEQQV